MKKWTLNTVWYLFLPVMEMLRIKASRSYVKRLVKELAEDAGITRESLGIYAGVRAALYFNGEWLSVSFDAVEELAEKGTDVICIEKEGVPEVLTEYADKYGIALVNTRGHLTEYGKALMKAAKQSGAHVAIMTDYDATGVKIASESPIDMPWIGINDATLEYFGLARESVSIESDTTANKEYIRKLVKHGQHPKDSKADNAGKIDTRFKDVDCTFLDNERVEIDAVLAKVEEERFFEYIKYKMNELYPTRDYNRAIGIPTEYYNTGDDFNVLPVTIRNVLTRIKQVADAATVDTETKIENELQQVKGFLDVKEKKKEVANRLNKALTENKHMKVIITKFEELMQPGVLPEVRVAEENRDDEDDDL
jgi:hypothetical protein